jgi:lipoprotein-anchoring transpeptidase ErfK/SrfK
MSGVRLAAATCLVLLTAAGCAGGVRHTVRHNVQHSARHSVEAPLARGCAPGSIQRVGTRATWLAAVAVRPLRAYASPGLRPFVHFGLRNVNGAATVFSVLAWRVDARCRPTWFHVELPVRPNGATGWVRAREVETTPVHARVVVDLSERRVRLYLRGRLVLASTAAIGSAATPTPTGRFYVNQRFVPSDPYGPYGSGAVGISAFSNVLTSWPQGGPVAIHGTNEPWSIGRAVSHGCIRLPNDVLRRLFAVAVAGTPVVIKP